MDKSSCAASFEVSSILCMPSLCIDNSLATCRHAVHKRSHEICVQLLPFGCDNVLQLLHRLASMLLDCTRHRRPEVLNRVEIRGVGREVDRRHARVVQMLGNQVGVELRYVVVQQLPLPCVVDFGVEARSRARRSPASCNRRSTVLRGQSSSSLRRIVVGSGEHIAMRSERDGSVERLVSAARTAAAAAAPR